MGAEVNAREVIEEGRILKRLENRVNMLPKLDKTA